jgi:hypothetical protein
VRWCAARVALATQRRLLLVPKGSQAGAA